MRRTAGHPADRLLAWVERCQASAGPREMAIEAACAALVRLARAIPRDLPVAQQLVVRRLLDEAWRRVLTVVAPAGGRASVPVPMIEDERVARTLAAIEQRHPDPSLRLQSLARELGVSPTHLTQVLKRATGLTFGAHLRERRIAAARLLLATSTLSVKEIAGRVGYSSTSQLDQHFKKLLCRSPSAYRALARQGRLASDVPVPRARYRPPPTESITLPQK